MYDYWIFNKKMCRNSWDNCVTSFAWRYEILDVLRLYIGTGHVSGLVESDETFFRLSYKGNHSKNKQFIMPRKPNLREPKSKKKIKGLRA